MMHSSQLYQNLCLVHHGQLWGTATEASPTGHQLPWTGTTNGTCMAPSGLSTGLVTVTWGPLCRGESLYRTQNTLAVCHDPALPQPILSWCSCAMPPLPLGLDWFPVSPAPHIGASSTDPEALYRALWTLMNMTHMPRFIVPGWPPWPFGMELQGLPATGHNCNLLHKIGALHHGLRAQHTLPSQKTRISHCHSGIVYSTCNVTFIY